MYPTVDN